MCTTRITFLALLGGTIALGAPRSVRGHFLVLVPESDVVDDPAQRTVQLDIRFTHPMERGPVMPMDRPVRFAVLVRGQRHDLAERLVARQIDGNTAYTASAQLIRPGDHTFYLEPAPYWEPAERKYIVHYTKVIVGFLGAEVGWDQPVGLPVEIEPLVRPYGLWTGNTFRGIVRHNGEPVPFARVEVEYLNDRAEVTPPNDSFVTQVVKTDASGVFSYTIPRAGWWGFAALVDGPQRPGPDGQPADVELGGLIWVRAVDMQ